MTPNSSLDRLREHVADPARNGDAPTSILIDSALDERTTYVVAVSREDARELYDTALFDGAVCVVSISIKGPWRIPTKLEIREFLACVGGILGADVPAKLRRVNMGLTRAIFFHGQMTHDGTVVDPTPLQEAFLARHLNARAATA